MEACTGDGTGIILLLCEKDACSLEAVVAILGGKQSECKGGVGSPGLGNVLELKDLAIDTSFRTSFLAPGTYLLLPTDELLLMTLADRGRGGLGILGGSGLLSSV